LEKNDEEVFGEGNKEFKSLEFGGRGVDEEKNKSKELTGEERLP
jgi:hypothetical protein